MGSSRQKPGFAVAEALDERFRNCERVLRVEVKERGGSRYPASSTTLDREIGRNHHVPFGLWAAWVDLLCCRH